jgi:RimJ/RimL family protein N-acetyltransferase
MEEFHRLSVPLQGRSINLRDAVPADLDCYRRWLRQGEWRELDAPWERVDLQLTDEDIEERFRRSFLSDQDLPRKRLLIALPDNHPIGWVIRYKEERFPLSCNIGIDICEDDQLNRGYGTEALRLWISYQFATSELHRIAFATYSFNARVARLAEKLGFTFEGRDREIIQWQGEWVDRLHFSVLRSEWESRPSSLT